MNISPNIKFIVRHLRQAFVLLDAKAAPSDLTGLKAAAGKNQSNWYQTKPYEKGEGKRQRLYSQAKKDRSLI